MDQLKEVIVPVEDDSLVCIYVVFSFIMTGEILVNIDAGAIPSVLSTIMKEFPSLTATKLGLLGALPYIGLIITAPLSAKALYKRNYQKYWLLVSLVACSVSGLVLASSRFVWLIFLGRFLIGVAQGPFVIYAPIWVDQFAPASSVTRWMGAIQASTVMGVMIGYLAAGFLVNLGLNWRYAILVEAVLLMVLAFCFALCPSRLIKTSLPSSNNVEISASKASSETTPASDPGTRLMTTRINSKMTPDVPINCIVAARSFQESSIESAAAVAALTPSGFAMPSPSLHHRISQDSVSMPSLKVGLGKLIRTPLYVWVVLSMASLFFVVTGIQYWVTQYFEIAMGVSRPIILMSFPVTAATAPTLGVILGGIFVDVAGGYRTPLGKFRTLVFAASWALIAGAAGLVFCFSQDSFVISILMLWVVLFFGAAILPPGAGILIDSVDPQIKIFASGISMLSYNILGYALGSFLPGVFIHYWGIVNGIRVIFSGAVVGILGITTSAAYAWFHYFMDN